MKENFAMSKVYSDKVQTSKMKFVSQEPHLRSLAGFWFVSAGRRGFLMLSEGKKQAVA